MSAVFFYQQISNARNYRHRYGGVQINFRFSARVSHVSVKQRFYQKYYIVPVKQRQDGRFFFSDLVGSLLCGFFPNNMTQKTVLFTQFRIYFLI